MTVSRTTSRIIISFAQKFRGQLKDHYRFIFPSAIPLPIKQRRIDVIQSRIRTAAWILALSIPAWGVLDAFAFPHDLWVSLLIARLLAGAAFAMFLFSGDYLYKTHTPKLWHMYVKLGIIFVVPTVLYLFCLRLPESVSETTPFALAITNSYYLLPFIMLSCLGFFPLTIIEATCVVTPLLAAYYVSDPVTDMPFASLGLGMFWIMALLAAIAIVISYSQLRMLVQLISYSSYDLLTDCLGRRSGEEVVKTLWHYSVRKKSTLSIALIDLDHFKLVNDSFGHPAGDAVLTQAASIIRSSLRQSDFVIRWGGEEFLVVMPDSDIHNTTVALVRMAEKGLGNRPDGSLQTVSIGVAERVDENTNDENALIRRADERLYRAKVSGRARLVSTCMINLTSEKQG